MSPNKKLWPGLQRKKQRKRRKSPKLQSNQENQTSWRLLALVLLAIVAVQLVISNGNPMETLQKSLLISDQQLAAETPRSLNLEHQHESPEPTSPYAYAFVIGGVSPSKPAYRGMLYSVWVAAYALRRKHHSKADFVLFVQMSYEHREDGLPSQEKRVLDDLGISLRYIPPSQDESFVEITMNKFVILTLTEYRRVIFLDADVLVLNNLDYLFEASDGPNATLKENYVMATVGEPSNAGFFMLAPKEGDYEEALQIIKDQRESAKNTTSNRAKFDLVKGWGHVIEAPDKWETTRLRGVTATGTDWSFYCAPSDQGFLYHWTKYVKKSVSNQIRDKVKNFGVYPNGTTELEEILVSPLDKTATATPNVLNHTVNSKWKNCKTRKMNKFFCQRPHIDYVHLVGDLKPWLKPVPKEGLDDLSAEASEYHYWYHLLGLVEQEYKVGIDFNTWEEEATTYKQPPLGKQPDYYREGCTGCVIE